jgi:hypothetical protein
MFINKITKEYPRFIGDLQLLHPDATLDNLPNDWVLVEVTPRPENQDGKAIYESTPQEINGAWKQQWVIRDLTAEEIARINEHDLKIKEFIAKLEAVQNESPAL